MGWSTFEIFLLDNFYPLEICFCNIHKKYRDAKQKQRQNILGLIRYLGEFEAQMVPAAEDHQMSTILVCFIHRLKLKSLVE